MQKSQTSPVLAESRFFQFLATFASLAIFVAGPLATQADSSAMTNPPASVNPTKQIPAIEPARKPPALVPFDKTVQSINAESIFKHVKMLSSDEMEGREIGTAGGVRAINYLVRKMRAAGLQPAGPDGKFIQPFDGNGHNVLGWIEGSDPKLKKEFIVIGAHLDHVGNGTNGHTRGPVGPVHNGADDNASGVAVVLEVARALAALDKKPKRSFLFIFFDG